MSFDRALWLFPVVVTVHNLEEALWLPRWAARHRFPTPGPAVFAFAVSVITVLTFVATGLAIRSGPQSFWALVLFGSMTTALGNVLIPHLALSVIRRSYMPGIGTAVVLIAPVVYLLVTRALRESFVSGRPALFAAILVPIALIPCIAGLFRLGRALPL